MTGFLFQTEMVKGLCSQVAASRSGKETVRSGD